MDHRQVEQFDLIDRYLMGRLPAEQSASFEEHFVDCPQCIARLQTTTDFVRDLRLVASEQALSPDRRQRGRAFWPSLRTPPAGPLVWAAGLLLVATVAGVLFVIDHTRRLRDEVNQAKALSEQWQRRYEEERQSAIAADARRQEAESQHDERIRAMEGRPKGEESQGGKASGEFRRPARAGGSLPILTLASVRGGGPGDTDSANRINVPSFSPVFALLIPLEDEREYESYHITILDDRDRQAWDKGGFSANRHDFLSIVLDAVLFKPGQYSLVLHGEKKGGGRDALGNYPFRVAKTR